MTTKAQKNRAKSTPKFAVRAINRCERCGRRRSYLRKFRLCRICFRHMAHSGLLPGVVKSSW